MSNNLNMLKDNVGEYRECRLQIDQKMGYIVPKTQKGLNILLKIAFRLDYIRSCEDEIANQEGTYTSSMTLEQVKEMYDKEMKELYKQEDELVSNKEY